MVRLVTTATNRPKNTPHVLQQLHGVRNGKKLKIKARKKITETQHVAPVRVTKLASPAMASILSREFSPYTPYEDLPERLQRAMQKLQRCKDSVNDQARRVVNVDVSEWQKADARAALSAAELAKAAKRAADLEAFTSARRSQQERKELRRNGNGAGASEATAPA